MKQLAQLMKNIANYLPSFEKLLMGCFTVSIFIHVPLFTFTAFSYYLGEKKDFLILFAWPSDILLALIALYALWNKRRRPASLPARKLSQASWILLAIAALNIASLIYNWNNLLIPIISIYNLLLLYKGYVLHETKALQNSGWRNIFERVFTACATGEAALAIFQFAGQQSLGLKLLGETHLGPYLSGVAKIDTGDLLFMRAYGTMPHPNLLGALLAVAALILISKFVPYATNRFGIKQYAKLAQILLIVTGLTLTFSRAAWFAAAIAVVGYATLEAWRKSLSIRGFIKISAYLSSYTIIVLIILSSLVQPRSDIFDKAYTERVSYNRAALGFISDSPLLGIGPAQSLLHMKQELGGTPSPWEVQPIHNYYLLYAAEYGIISLVLVLLYFFLIVKREVQKRARESSLALCLMLLAATLMFFDHYFMTLQPTILIFWLISSYFSTNEPTFGTVSPS